MSCSRLLTGVMLFCVLIVSGGAAVLDPLIAGKVLVATHLREIDPKVLAALKRSFSNDHGIADKGSAFASTDTGEPGPPRRLILAAYSGGTWFIHYEHGGRGLHSHLVAFAPSGSSWHIVYSACAFYAYDTIPKLQRAIQQGRFDMKTEEL